MTIKANSSEVRYKSSIDALRQLMSSDLQKENSALISHQSGKCCCTIIANPNEIFFTKSGIEYYYVEISCSNDIQYKIQAFGDEAVQLYKEVQRFACSKQNDGTYRADRIIWIRTYLRALLNRESRIKCYNKNRITSLRSCLPVIILTEKRLN